MSFIEVTQNQDPEIKTFVNLASITHLERTEDDGPDTSPGTDIFLLDSNVLSVKESYEDVRGLIRTLMLMRTARAE